PAPASAAPAPASAAPAPASAAPLRLAVAAQHDGSSTTGPVELTATLTNVSGAPCDVVDIPDGGMVVTSARPEGQAITPPKGRASLMTGIGGDTAAHVRTLAPGGSVHFVVDRGTSVTVLAPLRDGTGLATNYPVDQIGRYELGFLYRTPALAGAKACAGSSND